MELSIFLLPSCLTDLETFLSSFAGFATLCSLLASGNLVCAKTLIGALTCVRCLCVDFALKALVSPAAAI
jgi:hypothetical protein